MMADVRRKTLSAAARVGFAAFLIVSSPDSTCPQAGNSSARDSATLYKFSECGNLKEQIPKQYRGRYDSWKATFLSADVGRRLWLRYACRPDFSLTITVSKSMGQGGRIDIDNYQWAGGRLTAATISLGSELNQGYPGQYDYPVLGSLALTGGGRDGERGHVLAAAKIAHEFGHVEQAANSNTTYRLQNELSRAYVSRFLTNGYDADDPVLTDLVRRMGGMPAEIDGQREYWAETYALRYLLDKLAAKRRRELLRLVRKTLAVSPGVYYLPSQTEWVSLTSHD